jgi:biopolymer transport protein ExbD
LAEIIVLFVFLRVVAVMVPKPYVHVGGDREAKYESIGRVIFTTQRAGIQKVGFITEPPDKM